MMPTIEILSFFPFGIWKYWSDKTLSENDANLGFLRLASFQI